MIVRDRGGDWQVVLQPEHADLSEEVARAWADRGPRHDSLVVTGASTSGCIRATAVDALQHGYRVIVPRDAVGDRNPSAHEANLYDIDTKYGDVVTTADVLAALEVPA